MNAWHTVTDSATFRRLTSRGPVRSLFRSQAFQDLDVWRNRILSRNAVRDHPDLFRSVRTFCFFVGHNKSGTSMLGGLLDAHRSVILADEIDALRYIEAGFSREQIFYLLLKGSRAEARKGRVTARRLQPYSYHVPGQWQGQSPAPLVVGDSRSGTSTRRLGTHPELLDTARALMSEVDVKLIQVIRNPFDPISLMMIRGGRSFQDSIDHYFTSCEILVGIRRHAGTSLLPMRFERMVADPERGLRDLCGFLGIEAEPGYLASCASIIRPALDRGRELIDWTQPWISQVEQRSSAFDFLDGYAYDS